MFTLYNLFKFLHVGAAIVWVGGVVVLTVVNARLVGERDGAARELVSRQSEFVGRTVLGPSALVTLLAGFALMGLLGGGFRLWTVWGLVGVFGSMALGAIFVGRASREFADLSTAADPDPVRLVTVHRRIVVLSVINVGLLLSTVWAMIFKPTL